MLCKKLPSCLFLVRRGHKRDSCRRSDGWSWKNCQCVAYLRLTPWCGAAARCSHCHPPLPARASTGRGMCFNSMKNQVASSAENSYNHDHNRKKYCLQFILKDSNLCCDFHYIFSPFCLIFVPFLSSLCWRIHDPASNADIIKNCLRSIYSNTYILCCSNWILTEKFS